MILPLLAFCVFLPVTFGRLDIVPGATWTVPNTGDHLQAHGTGILKVGEFYYAVGENKTQTSTNPTGSYFNSVAVSFQSYSFIQQRFIQATISVIGHRTLLVGSLSIIRYQIRWETVPEYTRISGTAAL